MSAPLVLGIAGSPRRGGNSEQLLEACLAGAGESGARTLTLVPSELSIHPCLGCNACSLTGTCVQRDAMRDVYPLIDAAAAIVIASPVFFATVPATLKILIDRMQPYWARTHVLGMSAPAKRPGGILLVRGGGDPFGFIGAENTIKSMFAVLGIRVIAEEKVADVDDPDDVVAHPAILKRVRAHGAEIAGAVRHEVDGAR
ncbi:MAG: flavodoxin family protein [Coriobacteriia bacterium]